MVSGTTIRVCVLEGQHAQLSNLGFPISLVMELQQGGLRLGNAKWLSRLSDAGFWCPSSGQLPGQLNVVSTGEEES